MAGPVIFIELSDDISECALGRLHELLSNISGGMEVKRRGDFALQVMPERLGITELDTVHGRPVLVIAYGPSFGNENIFEAEHDDDVNLEALIGFTPVCSIGVIAMAKSRVDHLVIAELTAAVMGIVGGVAMVELDDGQLELVRDLPGLRAVTAEPWAAAYGSAEFVHSWAVHPEFRLLK